MLDNKDVLKIAMAQSAVDSSCSPEDFLSFQNKVVISKNSTEARRYLELPHLCDFISYGNGIVVSTCQDLQKMAQEYVDSFASEHCFETPNLHVLMDKLRPHNLNICFMAEYFLPDIDILKPLECGFETIILSQTELSSLYLPQWSNALCEKRKHLDMVAVGAYDGGELIGLAGCSADCDTMWQIGVDVLPKYRKQGVAASITSKLAVEVLERGIVPFYCCAWSNIKSARNAIKSGFKPAWVQMTVKTTDFIEKMNEK